MTQRTRIDPNELHPGSPTFIAIAVEGDGEVVIGEFDSRDEAERACADYEQENPL
ncbi:hypothetical protein [Halotalea alkalilenta]|uniref:hypothetical protein n=1 Tax=Halotalea alkalilenta TaxID=376489 RepID=UPI0012DDDF30|nr:hypothetical protein [Halotalea alkalilenta]